VYRDIIKNSTDDYEDERETNLAAVVANLCIEGSVRKVIKCYLIYQIAVMCSGWHNVILIFR
jgi:hypothetical protein